MPSITVTTETEVKLSPSVRGKLLRALRNYAMQKVELKKLEASIDEAKTAVADIRADTGHTSLSLEGYTITLVAPTRKVFNADRFVSLGGDLKLYNNCMDEVPVKAYDKITFPTEGK